MLQFRCPLLIFITSLRWPRGTVEMQGIEMAAIFSLLSSLFSLFSAPSSLLSSALDSRNRILAFSQGNMTPRGRPPRRNAAIRHDPGANTPCSELSWGSLSVPFCDILFFSLLASLAAATPGNVQTLMQNKLLLLSQIFLRVCLFDLFMRPSVSRQTVSFFGDTPILIEKVFFIELFTLLSLLNIPTSMPTWLFPFLDYLLQYSCTLDGAPHCFVPRRHFVPHPDVVISSKCFRI